MLHLCLLVSLAFHKMGPVELRVWGLSIAVIV